MACLFLQLSREGGRLSICVWRDCKTSLVLHTRARTVKVLGNYGDLGTWCVVLIKLCIRGTYGPLWVSKRIIDIWFPFIMILSVIIYMKNGVNNCVSNLRNGWWLHAEYILYCIVMIHYSAPPRMHQVELTLGINTVCICMNIGQGLMRRLLTNEQSTLSNIYACMRVN